MERTNHDQVQPHVKIMTIGQTQPLKAEGHACKASLRGHQQARDHLKRAERDLGETAAFIAASLTTVTAIQAAVGTLGTAQGRVGAAMNRLQFAISQAQTMSVSVTASESRIRDANK